MKKNDMTVILGRQGTNATPFQRHISACNAHDPSLYVPLVLDGEKIGLIRRDRVDRLKAFCQWIEDANESLILKAAAGKAATNALAEIVRELAGEGAFSLLGEAYPVSAAWGAPLLASIDRGAAGYFGTKCFGVHVNGFVRCNGELNLWIGLRAKDRVVAPGQLDNLIGGGMGAGYSPMETVIKEAGEEAGLSEEIAKTAKPAGTISYTQDTQTGVKRDLLFAYDLELPPGLQPVNRDGEVERFDLMPVAEVLECVRDTDDFKWNCNLVLIDFFIRHGVLTPDMPGYVELCAGLRRPN